ncbi:hypothetical protein DOY81_008928 [Sarcophaga bullata]|nr:hypothetical protein DOY81_008928 [Sarcophaga bullata]
MNFNKNKIINEIVRKITNINSQNGNETTANKTSGKYTIEC